MFFNCSNLISINLFNYNTQNILYMNYSFTNCYKLTFINISSFNSTSIILKDTFNKIPSTGIIIINTILYDIINISFNNWTIITNY